MSQLLLGVARDDSASLDNFFAEGNRALLETLQALSCSVPSAARSVYIWGGQGVGKTHLLSACIRAAAENGVVARCWQVGSELDPNAELVCVDDIHLMCGDMSAQRRLLTVYDGLRQAGAAMVLAGHQPPSEIGLELADLVSRLNAAELYKVLPLNDVEKQMALRQRAHLRGFALSDEVLRWLLGHVSRDMGYLLRVLDSVDATSLVEQKKVTLPLLKRAIARLVKEA